MKLVSSILTLSFIVLFCSCDFKSDESKDLTKEFVFRNDTVMKVAQDKDTLDVVFEIEIAASDYEKETGLMHRKTMKPNQGMLFVYDDEKPRPTFYMKNTYLSLDLIYLDKNLKVVDFNLNTTPLSEDLISSQVPAQYVLELKAGSVKDLNLKKGDYFIL
jgi:uncharacterized membrane protein (UPF0127 family)